jgi:hypothetical protein
MSTLFRIGVAKSRACKAMHNDDKANGLSTFHILVAIQTQSDFETRRPKTTSSPELEPRTPRIGIPISEASPCHSGSTLPCRHLLVPTANRHRDRHRRYGRSPIITGEQPEQRCVHLSQSLHTVCPVTFRWWSMCWGCDAVLEAAAEFKTRSLVYSGFADKLEGVVQSGANYIKLIPGTRMAAVAKEIDPSGENRAEALGKDIYNYTLS